MNTIIRLVTCLSLVFSIGCGETKKEEKKEGFQYEQAQENKDTSEEKSQNEVLITGDDLMKYSTKEIRVKAGEPVTLTLKHIGKLDIKVMGHNWVLLKEGTDLVGFASKASAAMDNDYIPEGTEDVIVHTKMLGGGESDTVTFDPPAPGTYQFLCTFPGHFAQMQGTFIVE
ncbi:azurin [Robertkochia marina]|uniref:Azurin n=1 Tax=Robertkochia marina TaxID=1227945 RepID=A0A4S3M3N2_9FLAO|nr:azurin [Robertkochia marina]THD69490.1 azurin [Robertkochia marina]TRZ47251.1 azurin [Robertkochia marina]